MRGTLMSINYFRQYELRNRDIVTLAPAHEVNGISITLGAQIKLVWYKVSATGVSYG